MSAERDTPTTLSHKFRNQPSNRSLQTATMKLTISLIATIGIGLLSKSTHATEISHSSKNHRAKTAEKKHLRKKYPANKDPANKKHNVESSTEKKDIEYLAEDDVYNSFSYSYYYYDDNYSYYDDYYYDVSLANNMTVTALN
jgi:hypothetical protein